MGSMVHSLDNRPMVCFYRLDQAVNNANYLLKYINNKAYIFKKILSDCKFQVVYLQTDQALIPYPNPVHK